MSRARLAFVMALASGSAWVNWWMSMSGSAADAV
jgi:hypothetical protein